MSSAQPLGIAVVAPTAAIVLPNTGVFHYAVIAAFVSCFVGISILGYQFVTKVLANK